ncbi:MFS transporter [Moorella naiadis]|uniref:MFS transporter n=1 Tax=Moorella naiadis (nom. illeg.) TaxID=3093670 RepID=UPI003D9CAA86
MTGTRYRYVILVTVWLLYVINYFDKIAVLNLLPFIRNDLGLSHEVIGLAASLFFLAYAIMQIPAGIAADKWGPKIVMGVSIVAFTCFSFLTGVIKSLTQFIIVRLGLGVGEGLHFSPSIRAIGDWFPPQEKGRATAFFTTSWTIAPAIIPVVVAFITAAWGWRMVFYLLAIPGIVGVLVLKFYMYNKPEEALQAGRINQEEYNYIKKQDMVKANTNTAVKVKPDFKEVAGDPYLWVITAIVFCKTSVYWGTTTWLTSYLVEQHGFNIKAMGFLAAIPFLVGLLGQMLGGTLMDKVFNSKARPVLSLAFFALAVVLYAVNLIPKGNIPILIIVFGLLGMFVVMYDGPIYAFVQLRYPNEMVGTVTGITQGIGQFGGFVAPIIAGFLIVTKATGISYHNVFLYFAGMAIIGTLLSLSLNEKPIIVRPAKNSSMEG